MEYAEAIFDLCREQGGPPTARAYGKSACMPETWAALYNGSLAHGNDYDDTHSESIVHIGGAVVPTAIAMAERLGSSGEKVLSAIVAGYEVAARVGMAASKGFHAQGFHPTGVCGAFSAAATAAHLSGLNGEQTANAFGIALSQASGSLQFLEDGTWTKRMHPGWSAHAGIIAAGLARRGYTGPIKTFEGRFGLYAMYANTVKPDLERAISGLGSGWEILETDVKPYPCGHISHPYMDCALKLRREHGLTPEMIESIEARVPGPGVPIVCEPAAVKKAPPNSYAARFSLQYAVAVILVKGRAGIEEFSDEAICDPVVLDLARRIEYVIDDSLPFPQAFPGWIRIRLRDGRLLEARMDASRGSREIPMTPDELREKFTANALRALPKERVDALWSVGHRLESIAHIAEFSRLTTT
jgi:2-methylcitrate dehydratase PrpD